MIKEKDRKCPACHNQTGINLGVKNGFRMLVCRSCGSIYSSNSPSSDELKSLEDHYDLYYNENYNEKSLTVPDFVRQRLDEIIEDFSPFFTHGRMLDVGFGAATLMSVARDKGWNVYGVEVSKPAVERAQKLGYEVFYGELSETDYPDNYFDVITASEIIEHCVQPEIMLNEVFRLLRPGGLFWATTPAAKGLSYKMIGLDWTVIDPPEHLQLFSKKGLSGMLKKANFSKSTIKTFSFNPFEVINVLRNRLKDKTGSKKAEFSRLNSSYALNDNLTKSSSRRRIKNLMNGTLNFLSMGDSLKIKAIK